MRASHPFETIVRSSDMAKMTIRESRDISQTKIETQQSQSVLVVRSLKVRTQRWETAPEPEESGIKPKTSSLF